MSVNLQKNEECSPESSSTAAGGGQTGNGAAAVRGGGLLVFDVARLLGLFPEGCTLVLQVQVTDG